MSIRPSSLIRFISFSFALLLFCSCRSQQPSDLIAALPFAEKQADTEVLLFGAPKTGHLLTSWSEPQRGSGGRFCWATTDRPAVQWSSTHSTPAYLHFRMAAKESFPMQVRFPNSSASQIWVDKNSSSQMIPLPQNANRIELGLPHAGSLGVHSAVITKSRVVSEFRKPQEFPVVEKLSSNGKKRTAMFYETGGSVAFYEMAYPASELEFGFYFLPSDTVAKDSAEFSIIFTGSHGSQQILWTQRFSQAAEGTTRLSLSSYVTEPMPVRLEFRIARNTAFGKGRTAWIEPRIYSPQQTEKKQQTNDTLKRAMSGANVLVLILDAASVRRIGCYGYARNTTPIIDGFARENVRFERAYTNAVYTLASSATILTGHLPVRHGILQHRNKLSPAAITMPEVLQASGLDTAAFLANGNVSTNFGLTQGFQTLREVFRDKHFVGRAEDITGAFREWLQKHGSRQFFSYLHYREPHDPYQPPGEWVSKFADSKYSGPILQNFLEKRPIEKNAKDLTNEDREFISALYDANLAYGDSQVGEVLRLLKDSNIYDRTMIVVTSDHGEAFWEHGYQGHNLQLYEESSRVPLIIKFPRNHGIPAKTISFPVQHADLLATLVDLLGLSLRGVNTDGSSFAPWLASGSSPDREIIVQSTKRHLNALILNQLKFIRNVDQEDELYDLNRDPMERNNLIRKESVRAGYMRQRLLRRLDAGSKKIQHTEKAAELDEASRENLKALGYLD